MSDLRIYLATYRSHDAVHVHTWDLAGDVRDVVGTPVGAGVYSFVLTDLSTPNLSNLHFKFWYPRETPPWEPDDYERCVPSDDVDTLWTAEYSARCMTSDPNAIGDLPTGTQLRIGAITRNRFAGGHIYAWDPASGTSRRFDEVSRDTTANISYFTVTLEPWMTAGFHFKLATAGLSGFEPDTTNRFWRPVDGTQLFIKSGQLELRKSAPLPVNVPISVTVPATLGNETILRVRDVVDDFEYDAPHAAPVALDSEFVSIEFAASVYADALYELTPQTVGSAGAPAYCPQWSLPLRVPTGIAPDSKYTLLGASEWYDASPVRDAVVELIVHANPASTFGSSIEVPWHLGFAQRTHDERRAPVAGTITARASGTGMWTANVLMFSGVPQWFDTLRAGPLVESRVDGPTLSQRDVRPGAGHLTVHTIDGQTGVSVTEPSSTLFSDVSYADRARLMKSAFSAQIVDSNVFEAHEMPHGATWHDDLLWFVLPAPHTIQASVLLLDRAVASPRRTLTVPMQLTADSRYFWCTISRDGLPDAARVEYRYLLDGETEILDPASRLVSLAEYVWAEPGEGPDAAWSIAVERNALATAAVSPGWQTPFWNELMIYELHAQRFSDRNQDGSMQLLALGQVEKELERYLASLPVTALELLPINEFPKQISWGYNSSLYFAIESSYGGPDALASLVKQSHASGKAIVLDVVFNHLTDSPMQAFAKDVFADGQTQWGDMVNYDHPACLEFFRQALIYLFDTFQVDGFRFDATEAIVNGHIQNGYIIRDGRTGSGGGWEFLRTLHRALDVAASACGRRLPYVVAENNPDNWGMDGQVVDGQWDFDFLGKLGWAAALNGDAAPEMASVLAMWRNVQEMVNPSDTHDSCSGQGFGQLRIAARGPWGTGLRMAKACGAVTLLAKGIPMFFMGAEAGESEPFYFDIPSSQSGTLQLNNYVQASAPQAQVLAWYRALLGLRKNWGNGFATNDTPYIGKGDRTVAFTRDDGHFFVIATFGTHDRLQDLGWLGLPNDSSYKEVFNSTWPAYNVDNDDWSDNGGYAAHLTASSRINLPQIGAVVLERI